MSLTEKQIVGNFGEDEAAAFLVKRGYVVVERNYRKPWGEIDIVAIKADCLHFIEVKTVSGETSDFFPEDNVHYKKKKRLSRAIETYLLEKKVPRETNFIIDVISIRVSHGTGPSEIDFLEDVIL